jgi:hypothetical protein
MRMIFYGGFPFSEPHGLETWWPLPLSGVYVVQTLDTTWQPWPLRPLYFGESGDLSGRGFPRSHHAYERWVREAGDASRLLVSVHFMLGRSAEDRRSLESRLIAQYNPPCNRPTLGELMFRMARRDEITSLARLAQLLPAPSPPGVSLSTPLARLAQLLAPPSRHPVNFSSLTGLSTLGWK